MLTKKAHFYGFVFDVSGTVLRVLPNAKLNVINERTGQPAECFSDDGTTPLPQPIIANAQGFYSFYCGERFDTGPRFAVTVVASGGGLVFSFNNVPADTVESHRCGGYHAPGTIGAEQLDPAIFTMTTSLMVHAALNCNTHGVPPTGSFAYSKGFPTCTSTADPLFGTISNDVDTTLQRFEGARVLGSGEDLQTIVAAASSHDTILLRPNTTYTLLTPVVIDKSLSIVSLGGEAFFTHAFGGAGQVPITIDAPTGVGERVLLEGFRLPENSTTGDPSLDIKGANRVDLMRLNLNRLRIGLTSALQEGLYATRVSCMGARNQGLNIQAAASAEAMMFSQCRFANNNQSAGGFAEVNIATGALSACGASFSDCLIETHGTGVNVDAANTRWTGCVFNALSGTPILLDVDAAATNTYAPTGINTFKIPPGTINDPSNNILGDGLGWDYDSGIITIDNSAGALGIDQYFTALNAVHNLNTRCLEWLLHIGDNSNLNNLVWSTSSVGTDGRGSDATAPGYWYVVSDAANSCKVIGAAQNGVDNTGAIIATGDYVWVAPDPAAMPQPTNNLVPAMNLNFKVVYIRLLLRRAG